MTRKPFFIWTAASILTAMCPGVCTAQNPTYFETTAPQKGIEPFASYALDKAESINLSSGAVNYHFRLGSIAPVPSGLDFGVDLFYNSDAYEVGYDDVTYQQTLHNSPDGGWHYGYDYELRVEVAPQPSTTFSCGDLSTFNPYTYKFIVIFPDGSHHDLLISGGTGADPGGSDYFEYDPAGQAGSPCVTSLSSSTDMHYYTADGTYLRLVTYASGASDPANWGTRKWTLFFPDGRTQTRNTDGTMHLVDSHGYGVNITQLVTDCFEDSAVCIGGGSISTSPTYVLDYNNGGTSVNIVHNLSGGTDPYVAYDQVNSTGAGSSPLTATVNFGVINWSGGYLLNGGDLVSFGGQALVVTSLAMPAASSGGTTPTWNFGYETSGSSGSGELNSVTLPTGATVNYDYALSGGVGGNVGYLAMNPVNTKTVTHDSLTENWYYKFSEFNTTSECTHTPCTVATDPSGGVTLHYRNPTAALDDVGLIYKTIHPDGSTDETLWWHNYSYPISTSSAPISMQNPYSRVRAHSVASSGTPGSEAFHVSTLDKNGNETMSQDYDWITYSSTLASPGCPPGTLSASAISGFGLLLRTTITNFLVAPPNTCEAESGTAYSGSTVAYYTDTAPARLNLAQNSYTSGTGTGSALAFDYDSSGYGIPTGGPGDATSEWHWDSGKLSSTMSGFLSSPGSSNARVTTRTFDAYGNVTYATTGSHSNSFTYDSYGLYLTNLTFGISSAHTSGLRHFTQSHDSAGFLSYQTDTDNSVTTNYYRDYLGRITARNDGGARYSTWTYYDPTHTVLPLVVMVTDGDSYGDHKLTTATTYNQLGQVFSNRTLESTTGDPTDTTVGIKEEHYYGYESGDRYEIVTNPFREATYSAAESNPTMGFTTTRYNTSGRLMSVTKYDGSVSSTGATSWTYDSYYSTVQEANGVKRRNMVDGLGRLEAVREDPDSSAVDTTYTYDSLGNLATVTQGSTDRTFTYDSLSEVVSAANPESGTTAWTYDDYGNAVSKEDARSITATMGYDELGRITSKSYPAPTPSVSYGYDSGSVAHSSGRLTSVTSSASDRYINAYDILGRPTDVTQVTGGVTQEFYHTWNPAGGLISTTMPSGRSLSWLYDGAQRFCSVSGTFNSLADTYAGSATYAAHGGLTSLTLDNGLIESTTWNARLQPTQIQTEDPVTTTYPLTLSYTYGASASANNGNVTAASTVRGSQTWSHSYSYDAVNRLTGDTETGPGTGWTNSFGYDHLGNRWVTASPLMLTNETPLASTWYPTTDNRVRETGTNVWTYDSAGNITAVGEMDREFAYDGEERQTCARISAGGSASCSTITAGVELYTYDGDGNRVTKANSSGTTIYFYDGTGELAEEYSTVAPAHAGTQYLSVDSLGSTRLETDGTQQPVKCTDFLPFGEEIPSGTDARSGCYGNPEAVGEKKFTGKERDAESGLDFFGARYMSSAQGRFTSPDPLLNSSRPDDPQSWNRYSYVRNNPLSRVDPTGLYDLNNTCAADDKKCNKAFAADAKNLKNGLTDLQKKVNGMKDGAEKTRLQNALGAIGTEGDHNNVTVAFGANKDGAAGNTDPIYDPKTNGYSGFNVTLDPNKINGPNGYAIDAAHEGTHMSDFERFMLNANTAMDAFQLEYRGYQTSAWSAQALGLPNVSFRGTQIWNSSWAAADRQVLQDRGITKVVTDRDHPESQPHNPQPNQ